MKPLNITYRGFPVYRLTVNRDLWGLRWTVYFTPRGKRGHHEYPLDGWKTRAEALAAFYDDPETKIVLDKGNGT